MSRRMRRGIVVVAMAMTVIGATVCSSAAPASAGPNLPQVPVIVGNPDPLTDLFASTIAVLTGGTERLCATSARGIPVHCVEHTVIQPSGSPDASATTYAHWIFCVNVCQGS